MDEPTTEIVPGWHCKVIAKGFYAKVSCKFTLKVSMTRSNELLQ